MKKITNQTKEVVDTSAITIIDSEQELFKACEDVFKASGYEGKILDLRVDNNTLEVQLKPTPEKTMDRVHDVKINTNRLIKLAEDSKIPIFIAYYDPQKGYQYDGVLPEEVDMEDVQGQYGRFIEFMKICINFNKEDYKPMVCKKTPNKSLTKNSNDIDDIEDVLNDSEDE